jgi:hypothetical protein
VQNPVVSLTEREREEERARIIRAAYAVVQADAAMDRIWNEPARKFAFLRRLAALDEAEPDEDIPSDPAALLASLSPASEAGFPSYVEVKSTAEYKVALRRWRRAMERIYSVRFLADVERLRAGDHGAVEAALLFLEADPWCFRSGYVKQNLVRYLRHVVLTEDEKDRLRRVMISAVRSGPRMEFREYCRTARVLDSPTLREWLETLSVAWGHGDGVHQRARWMLEAIEGRR